ncbi:MAG TPA: PKD domain-containing protein, partial [Gemmataceae bacterium]|nr:PKD domain-containing protein [Gemmataceae bacterium]
IKPAKPIANFAFDLNGFTVTFYNHSSGSGEGWFDFGDGTPLEPISPKQSTFLHTYTKPDIYYAKLTWRNLLGDENERSVKIELESPKIEKPAILSLEAIPITPGAFAPATFRLVSRAKNAKLCVWDCGDERCLEFCSDNPENQDRLVTFKKGGGYMVKLAAVNGDQAAEKSTIVFVDEPPPCSVAAIVSVIDQGTRVEKIETPIPVTANFPPGSKENTYHFERQVAAKQGFEVKEARLDPVNDQSVRNLEVRVASDRQSVRVLGELVRETGFLKKNSNSPSLMVRVLLTQERRVSESHPPLPVTGTVCIPGSLLLGLPPLPENWMDARRDLRIELHDGDKIAWPDSALPRNTPVTLQNRKCTLTATNLGNQVRIDLVEVKTDPARATE